MKAPISIRREPAKLPPGDELREACIAADKACVDLVAALERRDRALAALHPISGPLANRQRYKATVTRAVAAHGLSHWIDMGPGPRSNWTTFSDMAAPLLAGIGREGVMPTLSEDVIYGALGARKPEDPQMVQARAKQALSDELRALDDKFNRTIRRNRRWGQSVEDAKAALVAANPKLLEVYQTERAAIAQRHEAA